MTPHDAFLAAILDNPADDTPWHIFHDWLIDNGRYNRETLLALVLDHPESDSLRLLYALWCEEQGDTARADLIRVQVELFRTGIPPEIQDPHYGAVINLEYHRHPLAKRERKILNKNQMMDVDGGPMRMPMPNWMAWSRICDNEPHPLYIVGEPRVFRRGFVAAVTVTADDWLRHADALTAAQPIEEVTLTTWPKLVSQWGAIHDGAWHHLKGRVMQPMWHSSVGALQSTIIMGLLNQEWGRIKFALPPAPAIHLFPGPQEVYFGGQHLGRTPSAAVTRRSPGTPPPASP